MKQIPHEVSPRLVTTHALILALAVTGAAPEGMAQEERRETVVRKAIEQFENSPLKTIPVDKGISNDGGQGRHCTALHVPSHPPLNRYSTGPEEVQHWFCIFPTKV